MKVHSHGRRFGPLIVRSAAPVLYVLIATSCVTPPEPPAAPAKVTPDKPVQSFVTHAPKGVQIQNKGEQWRPLAAGVMVEHGTALRTTARAEVDVKLGEATGIKLDENTEVKVSTLQKEGQQGKQSLGAVLDVLRGRVYIKTKKTKRKSQFRLKTPTGLIVVRGTEFYVEVLADQSTKVVVREGIVAVSLRGDEKRVVEVRPNQKVHVAKTKLGTLESITPTESKLLEKTDRIVVKAKVAPCNLHDALKAVNPRYNGKGKFTMEFGKIVAADLSSTDVSDIGALKGLPLRSLALSSTGVSDLTPLRGMPLTQLQLMSTRRLTDLSPLKGLPLTHLTLSASAVRDIGPLRGLPLKSLRMLYVAVQDLAPLEGMPLVILSISPKYVKKGMDTVRGIKSLRLIATNAGEWTKRQTAAQFWKNYDAGVYGKPPVVAAVPPPKPPPVEKKPVDPPEPVLPKGPFDTPEKLHAALRIVNPEYDGKGELQTEDGKIVKVMLYGRKIADIGPLKDLPLTSLNLPSTRVTDISALEGMPLKFLYLKGSPVADISVLRGMPLVSLGLQNTKVSDISPLAGIQLAGLYLDGTPVADIGPLKGMPLTALGLSDTKVTDLSPLRGMPLEKLLFTPENIKTGMDVIRSMQSLTVMASNDDEWRKRQAAADFWKKHDGVEVAVETKPAAGVPAPAAAAKVKPELEGTWVGRDLGVGKHTFQFVIAGNQMGIRDLNNNKRYMGDITHVAGSPAKMDFLMRGPAGATFVGKTKLMIYKIEGNTLTLATGESGSPKRPVSFDPAGAEAVWVLTKQAPAAGGKAELKPGGTFGKYQIEKLIAQGNIGDVWRARGPTGRTVALKTLQGAPAKLEQMMQYEVSITKDIKHPGLVEIYDTGSIAGTSYCAMEFVEGKPLDAYLKGYTGPPRWDKTTETLGKALEAMDAYNQHHIVHRLIQPAHILVSRNGSTKIMDFGWARRGDVDRFPKGATVGSAAFTSPEQWSDPSDIDIRSDLYALGVTFYKAITGKDCYVCKDKAEWRAAALAPERLPMPIGELAPDMPKDLAAFITKLMAKKATDRYQTPKEALQALGRIKGPVAGRNMTPTQLHAALKAANPKYNGKGQFRVEAGRIVEVNLYDLDVADITPLKGLPLTKLSLANTKVADIGALKGMPLTSLACARIPASDISALKGMPLAMLNLHSCPNVKDISPLEGMPLTGLNLVATKVTDISVLKGMPLKTLLIWLAEIPDLSPLAGAQLEDLQFSPQHVRKGMNVIRGMKSLKVIGTNNEESRRKQTPSQFWKNYDAGKYGKPIPAAPAGAATTPAQLHAALKAVNPEYNGKGRFTVKGGKITAALLEKTGVSRIQPLEGLPLTMLDISHTTVRDITMLKGMQLTLLDLGGTEVDDISSLRGQPIAKLDMGGTAVSDIRPLAGAPLVNLVLDGTKVTDVGPLKGMPLGILQLSKLGVRDLSPLKGMPLKTLTLYQSRLVTDLSPVKGAPLTYLDLGETAVRDLTPLRGMKLTSLRINFTAIRDLSPLRGMPLTFLDLKGCDGLSDITPLEGMPLKKLVFTPGNIKKGMDVLRRLRTLTEIGPAADQLTSPAKFWRKYDAGEYGKAKPQMSAPKRWIRYRTAEKAPVAFDAWTFFWPRAQATGSDGATVYGLFAADGKLQFESQEWPLPAGQRVKPRSDFGPDHEAERAEEYLA